MYITGTRSNDQLDATERRCWLLFKDKPEDILYLYYTLYVYLSHLIC